LKVREDWELLRAGRSRYEPLLRADGARAGADPDLETDYGLGSVQANRG
jgi:hypothetical protein